MNIVAIKKDREKLCGSSLA